jgi:hypothetical protein
MSRPRLLSIHRRVDSGGKAATRAHDESGLHDRMPGMGKLVVQIAGLAAKPYRGAFLVARLRGGVRRSAMVPIAEGTKR